MALRLHTRLARAPPPKTQCNSWSDPVDPAGNDDWAGLGNLFETDCMLSKRLSGGVIRKCLSETIE